MENGQLDHDEESVISYKGMEEGKKTDTDKGDTMFDTSVANRGQRGVRQAGILTKQKRGVHLLQTLSRKVQNDIEKRSPSAPFSQLSSSQLKSLRSSDMIHAREKNKLSFYHIYKYGVKPEQLQDLKDLLPKEPFADSIRNNAQIENNFEQSESAFHHPTETSEEYEEREREQNLTSEPLNSGYEDPVEEFKIQPVFVQS